MTDNGTIAYVSVIPMCDIHKYTMNNPNVPAKYDGKTSSRGPWAYMCAECFTVHGIGLGIGKGQELKVRE